MLNGRVRSTPVLSFNIEHSTFTIQHSLLTHEMVRSHSALKSSVTQKSALRLAVEPLAIAIVLAFGVRAALRLYVIPSASMAPTLVPGDHIVVTPYRLGKKPSRGDVIVFRSPRAADELMIKRVIGTPGDLVETRAGRVIVCGHALPERRDLAADHPRRHVLRPRRQPRRLARQPQLGRAAEGCRARKGTDDFVVVARGSRE
jgi:signal peptidase I